MKGILLLFLASFIFQNCISQSVDSACFHYVLENPKFFGEKARSSFEISGLIDKKAEARINKTLRKKFRHKTGFYQTKGEYGWTQGNDTVAPAGFSDYVYPDQTYYENAFIKHGWIRFNDSERYLKLTLADHSYGSGVALESFHFRIAPDKIAYICIHKWKHLGEFETIELTFSLVDGRQLSNNFIVRLNPDKKDSLVQSLDSMARQSLKGPDGILLDCKLIPARPASDTCLITSESLICWLNKETSGCGVTSYGRGYTADCNPSGLMTCSVGLHLHALIPFLRTEDWNQLQEIYR